MNTQKKRFEYKPTLCYLHDAEQEKDNRESEPTGDGINVALKQKDYGLSLLKFKSILLIGCSLLSLFSLACICTMTPQAAIKMIIIALSTAAVILIFTQVFLIVSLLRSE